MPKLITIFVAKFVFRVGRLFGKGGTSLPGLVAEKIDSQILLKLKGSNFKAGIIVITGTNGKTTTATLTSQILRDAGLSVVHNKGGSNLYRGIVSTLIQSCNMNGKIKADYAVFETDENAFGRVITELGPDTILITNLFRDQLDRYGELDTTANKLAAALSQSSAHIVLNADDPLVASLGKGIKAVTYFGVADYVETVLDDRWSADSVVSPFSASKLIYQKRYYSHIGIYKSENGDFIRPTPKYEAKHVIINKTNLNFTVESQQISVPMSGFYNVYNVLGSYAIARLKEIESQEIAKSLRQISPAFGRLESIHYDGVDTTLLLVKNPVGFNQVIEGFLLHNPATPLLLCLNDNFADSRDVSWIWDVSFEALQHHKATIIVAGSRAYDLALRLKYANVENITTIIDTSAAFRCLIKLAKDNKKAFVIPTYTAMLDLRSYLVKKRAVEDYWQ